MSLGANLIRATNIRSRDDLVRWQKRSKKRLKLLVASFLIGGSIFAIWGSIIGVINAGNNSSNPLTFQEQARAALNGALTAFCCFSPLVVFAYYALLSSGLTTYKRTMKELAAANRVCSACEAVALFDDQYVNPSSSKGHTPADLVPKMHVINKNGKAYVLCDACMDESEHET